MIKLHYQRYFQPGLKIVLKRVRQQSGDERFESLTGVLIDGSEQGFDVNISQGSDPEEVYPFTPGMSFELFSDNYGLGLRLTVHYQSSPAANLFRFSPQGDLELIFRRQHLRTELLMWAGYRRRLGNLRTLRRHWKQHTEQCAAGLEPANLPPIHRISVSLGGGGVGMKLAAPVNRAELCLIYLALDDKGPLVCAVAEIVSAKDEDDSGLQASGMRFLNILEKDRTRIIRVVRQAHREPE
jgi:hypothetical protein